MSEGYHGFTNYETWNCKLWIDNEEGSYHHFREIAEEKLRDNDGDKDDTMNDIAEYLGSWVEENNPLADGASSMYTDILGAALNSINFYEIAEMMYDSIDDDVKAEFDEAEDEEEDDEEDETDEQD